MKRSRRLVLIILISLGLLSVTTILVLTALLDSAPSYQTSVAINSDTAQQVMQLSRTIKRQLSGSAENIKLVATEDQLNGLINIAQKANFKLTGRVNISKTGLSLELSKEMPNNLFGKYLNFSLLAPPSSEGLELAYVKLGALEFSGSMLLALTEQALNSIVLDRALSANFLSEIKAVSFSDNTITIDYHQTRQAKKALKHVLKRFFAYRSEFNPSVDSTLIRQYYQVLIDTASSIKSQNSVRSLANYIQPLFKEAFKRSTQGNAIAHNRAALTAFTLYFTSARFEYLVGNVITPLMKLHRRHRNATLAGRVDLQRHFVYSAAIELFSSTGISDLLGELKELLDSNKGGSGFSFVDLLADRAGVRFSQLAVSNEATARQLQKLINDQFDEQQLFPDIDNLIEGLTNAQFEQQYQTINAQPYKKLLSNINKRLSSLPIYQLSEK